MFLRIHITQFHKTHARRKTNIDHGEFDVCPLIFFKVFPIHFHRRQHAYRPTLHSPSLLLSFLPVSHPTLTLLSFSNPPPLPASLRSLLTIHHKNDHIRRNYRLKNCSFFGGCQPLSRSSRICKGRFTSCRNGLFSHGRTSRPRRTQQWHQVHAFHEG